MVTLLSHQDAKPAHSGVNLARIININVLNVEEIEQICPYAIVEILILTMEFMIFANNVLLLALTALLLLSVYLANLINNLRIVSVQGKLQLPATGVLHVMLLFLI